MPQFSSYRKRYNRKPAKKQPVKVTVVKNPRKKPRDKLTYMKSPQYGFADTFLTKLRYVEWKNFGGSYNPNAQVYRINSLFDPDLTGTGHQPMYFDQIAQIYQKYLVYYFVVKMSIQNQAATGTDIAYTFSDTDVSASSVQMLAETKFGQSLAVNTSTGQPVVYRRAAMPLNKLHGQRGLDQDTSEYALITANPTDVAVFIFKAIASDGATTLNLNVKFELTYYCKFKEQYEIGQS